MPYQFSTFDDAAKQLCFDLLHRGQEVSTPRTGKFLELRNVVYTVANPCDRILNLPLLKQYKLWAYGEILTEFLSLNPPLMEQYTSDLEVIKMMRSFHRGDSRANYTYGGRWHNNGAFQKVIKRLTKDKYSRQAVMTIYDSAIDLDAEEWNVPCTILHQFLIRQRPVAPPPLLVAWPTPYEDYLNLTVYLRSNDFFKGFKYDIFLNSFILEAFAGFLNCKVGELTFVVGSFHVYQQDLPKLDMLKDEKIVSISQQARFSLPFEDLYHQLWLVHYIQESERYGASVNLGVYDLIQPFKQWAEDFIKYYRKGE